MADTELNTIPSRQAYQALTGWVLGGEGSTYWRFGLGSFVLTDASGRVGLGTTSPACQIDIVRDDNAHVATRIRNNSTGASAYVMMGLNANGNSWGWRMGSTAANANRMELVREAFGTPAVVASFSTGGAMGLGIVPAAQFHVRSPNDEIARFESSNANPYISFYSTAGRQAYIQIVGSEAVALASSSALYLGAGGYNRLALGAAGTEFGPFNDNVMALGAANKRFTTIYAASGTINTSDAREKTWRGALTDAELRAAKTIAHEVGFYRFNEAIAVKGDAARLHCGVTAQGVVAALKAEGLDPFAYGFVCHDSWEAEEESEDRPAHTAGDRYGVRYEELLTFLAAAFEARIAALEDLLAPVEG